MSVFSAHSQDLGLGRKNVDKVRAPMRAPTQGNHYLQGTTRPDNAYFRVGCLCIMHLYYVFFLCILQFRGSIQCMIQNMHYEVMSMKMRISTVV